MNLYNRLKKPLKKAILSPFLHLFSLVSCLWVILNLLFWVIPLAVAGCIKFLLPLQPIIRACNRCIDFCYHAAVRINSFWMIDVAGIEIIIEGELPEDPAPIVVCNHQSWFDIPLVQHVVTDQGPIVKFMIKQQLIWVPVIGWICLALNFPRLSRGQGKRSGTKDLVAIQNMLASSVTHPGGILMFPEGTRFTPEKQAAQKSPFKSLLLPRAGGLRIIRDQVPANTSLVDLTIRYDGGDSHFWHCMHRATKTIHIRLDTFNISEVEDMKGWLQASWHRKDKYLNDTNFPAGQPSAGDEHA